MLTDAMIAQQLQHVLDDTQLDFLGSRYRGKVRDNYTVGTTRYIITTDRLSCFDVVVTTVPFKGQVLNELAAHWFRLSREIVPNHVLDVPDPNVMIVSECEILPVEVVVRAYVTGSAWRDYQAGKAVSGIRLPEGLRQNERLPQAIITPSTKAEKGSHDLPISEEDVVRQRLVDGRLWQQIRETALALFALGQREAEQRGLILVDTKYEFGLLNGALVLADEIHTLDSSRYWLRAEYQTRFEKGEPQVMLDKEPTRQWLLAQGYHGDGPIPEFTAEHRVNIARHYINAFETVTGQPLQTAVGPVHDRIAARLRALSAGGRPA